MVAARTSRVRRHAGIANGIYHPGELDHLRDEWDRADDEASEVITTYDTEPPGP